MDRIVHKRGDTFAPMMQYCQSDKKTPASLAGVTIKSQMRDEAGNLVHDFTLVVEDEALGKYKIVPISTSSMALGLYEWDIKYTQNGMVDHTDWVEFELVKTITD